MDSTIRDIIKVSCCAKLSMLGFFSKVVISIDTHPAFPVQNYNTKKPKSQRAKEILKWNVNAIEYSRLRERPK